MKSCIVSIQEVRDRRTTDERAKRSGIKIERTGPRTEPWAHTYIYITAHKRCLFTYFIYTPRLFLILICDSKSINYNFTLKPQSHLSRSRPPSRDQTYTQSHLSRSRPSSRDQTYLVTSIQTSTKRPDIYLVTFISTSLQRPDILSHICLVLDSHPETRHILSHTCVVLDRHPRPDIYLVTPIQFQPIIQRLDICLVTPFQFQIAIQDQTYCYVIGRKEPFPTQLT